MKDFVKTGNAIASKSLDKTFAGRTMRENFSGKYFSSGSDVQKYGRPQRKAIKDGLEDGERVKHNTQTHVTTLYLNK